MDESSRWLKSVEVQSNVAALSERRLAARDGRYKIQTAPRRLKSSVARILGWAVSLSLLASTAVAAGQTGSIAGTVADPTGAIIPGIAVVISSRESGQQQAVSTDSDGTFVCPDLPPGIYQVEIHVAGFAPLQDDGLK